MRRSWRDYSGFVAFATLCVLLTVGIMILARVISVLTPAPLTPAEAHVTPIELVSTLLTGLTIALAVLALMIAGLAIWGYHEIKSEAGKIARREARRAAVATVKTPEVQRLLMAEVGSLVKEGLNFASAQPPQEGTIKEEVDSEKVGKPRKRKKGGKNEDAK